MSAKILRHLDPHFLVARYAHHSTTMLAAEIMKGMPQPHALLGNLLRHFHAVALLSSGFLVRVVHILATWLTPAKS